MKRCPNYFLKSILVGVKLGLKLQKVHSECIRKILIDTAFIFLFFFKFHNT